MVKNTNYDLLMASRITVIFITKGLVLKKCLNQCFLYGNTTLANIGLSAEESVVFKCTDLSYLRGRGDVSVWNSPILHSERGVAI